jgi:tetratricopeptide (TPR) repeat protein
MNNNNYYGENLIFIISQPRAGSTLLQRILASHAEILSVAEPWIMLHPVYALKISGISMEYDAALARKGLDDFLSQFEQGKDIYYRALRRFAETLYCEALGRSHKRYFLDKTPRYYNIIPELNQMFPDAKFIILLRNPMAVLSSVLKTWRKNRHAELVKSANWPDVIKAPSLIARGMQILKDKAKIVRYEDLVNHTENTITNLCNYLNIEFNSDLLNYGDKNPPDGRFGDQVGIVKHRRAVPNYIDKWTENLSTPELYEFSLKYLNELGHELISELGYSYTQILDKLHHKFSIRNLNHEKKKNCNLQTTKEPHLRSAISEEFILIQKGHDDIKKDPTNAKTHNNLAILYCRVGDDDKALFHFHEALKIEPENNLFNKNLATFFHLRLGNIEEALKIYINVLAKDPLDIDSLLAAGDICKNVGKFEDALYFNQRVLEIDSTNKTAQKDQSKIKSMIKSHQGKFLHTLNNNN